MKVRKKIDKKLEKKLEIGQNEKLDKIKH